MDQQAVLAAEDTSEIGASKLGDGHVVQGAPERHERTPLADRVQFLEALPREAPVRRDPCVQHPRMILEKTEEEDLVDRELEPSSRLGELDRELVVRRLAEAQDRERAHPDRDAPDGRQGNDAGQDDGGRRDGRPGEPCEDRTGEVGTLHHLEVTQYRFDSGIRVLGRHAGGAKLRVGGEEPPIQLQRLDVTAGKPRPAVEPPLVRGLQGRPEPGREQLAGPAPTFLDPTFRRRA
jgi:hypothetical protein